MPAIVLTACTNRKKRRPSPGLTAGSLPKGALAEVAEAWLSRIAATQERIAANELYCGRSFVEARLAAERRGAALFVASAGLGLIDADTEIPSYSLTVSNGAADNVLARVEGGARTPADWWRRVSTRSPFGERLEDLARRRSEGPILVALAAPYLRMLEGDLAGLPETVKERLRIFVRSGDAVVAEGLRRCVMPYDGRLDGEESPLRGTHGDFAQRAARHFAEAILGDGNDMSLEEHRTAVKRHLARLTPPSPIQRAPATDDQIKEHIRAHWAAADGRVSRMLRVLRDELQVACEQGRFGGLFREVQAEREETP